MDNGSQPATRADDTLGNRIDSKLDALENRFERKLDGFEQRVIGWYRGDRPR